MHGLNVKDHCLLKYGNIGGDFIVLQRAKTIATKRSNPEPIRIALKEDARHIIAKWWQKFITPETYIFPCLKIGITPEQEPSQVQLLTI